ncbi:uncharacterized protein LOC130764613 [Actinidia eriantha]|uniref:uncharacterized protein LOC130764613 n=1 Tax=Actinidia eriantha TaxID=165200 RepID=UPI002590A585|nr:uncharacterized protein LOC130764613 [Actinidia eriantha]
MGSRGRAGGNYRFPCLTMHQSWASLLVHGIKRIEGRSWPSPIREYSSLKSSILITGKVSLSLFACPRSVHNQSNERHLQGNLCSKWGCVEVVGCVTCEELVSWEELPEWVSFESQTDSCWLCEQPKKLIVPFEIRGYHGVYNLEKKIYEAAARGLCQVNVPLPVKFPLPDPRDLFSLKPGSLALKLSDSEASKMEKPPSLNVAIAGARAAAM